MLSWEFSHTLPATRDRDRWFEHHTVSTDLTDRSGARFGAPAMADFGLDGDADIFTMEQEDSQILPQGAPIRAFFWENLDGKGGKFSEHIVLDKHIGGHDVQFGDADRDGDLDAYFKVWEALSGNAYGGKGHVDFLENVIVR